MNTGHAIKIYLKCVIVYFEINVNSLNDNNYNQLN